MADLSDAANWFETDASNNRPPPNGWPEGMMPSTVNDTARGDKGALKRFWDKINPVQTITPASGVWTFTTSNTAYPAAYVDGEVYSFTPATGSVGADQFQVNALGAKPIWKRVYGGSGFAAIGGGDIISNVAASLVYNTSLAAGAGAFLLLNPFVPAATDGAGGITLSGNVTAANLYSAGNLYLGQNYVFYAGNTSGAIGPYSYGDNTNLIQRLGSGNGGFYFENSAGTNVAQITNNGSLIAQGNIALGGNSINFAGSGTGGPNVSGDAANMAMQLGPSNGQFIWYSHAGATLMALAGVGGLTVNGGIVANGPNGILQFVDGTGSPTWGWYATGNVARLWSSAVGDRVSVDSGGNLLATGTLTATGFVYAQGHASKAGAGGGFTGNSFNIEWRPSRAHLWIDTSDLGAIVLGDGSGNLTLPGNLVVNGSGGITVAGAGDSHFNGGIYCLGVNTNNGGINTGTGSIAGGEFLSNTTGIFNAFVAAYAGGSAVFYAVNGGMTASAFNVVSDASTKEHITRSAIGLAQILGLAPKAFNRIATPEREEHGLIAQEVAAIMPHAVVIEHEDKRAAIDYAPITAALINAVKELTGRIVTLEAK